MKKSNIWRFEFNIKSILLIIFCIVINFIGRYLAIRLELPFWLDSIGTCLSAVILGPISGIVVGTITNITVGLMFYDMLPYVVVSIAIAIVVGVSYPEDNDYYQVAFTAILVSIIAIICSVLLNLKLFYGLTGNKWGDALFTMLRKYGTPVEICSALAQSFIDIPDKAITLLIVALVIRFKDKVLGRKSDVEKEN